jgi:hypothetical protein
MEDAVLWLLGPKGLAGARLDTGTCRETTSDCALTALWRIGQPLARVEGKAAGLYWRLAKPFT